MKQVETKSEVILSVLSPLDPEVQHYLSIAKNIQRQLDGAEDENDPCVPVELVAEFITLQEDLYKKAIEQQKKGAN